MSKNNDSSFQALAKQVEATNGNCDLSLIKRVTDMLYERSPRSKTCPFCEKDVSAHRNRMRVHLFTACEKTVGKRPADAPPVPKEDVEESENEEDSAPAKKKKVAADESEVVTSQAAKKSDPLVGLSDAFDAYSIAMGAQPVKLEEELVELHRLAEELVDELRLHVNRVELAQEMAIRVYNTVPSDDAYACKLLRDASEGAATAYNGGMIATRFKEYITAKHGTDAVLASKPVSPILSMAPDYKNVKRVFSTAKFSGGRKMTSVLASEFETSFWIRWNLERRISEIEYAKDQSIVAANFSTLHYSCRVFMSLFFTASYFSKKEPVSAAAKPAEKAPPKRKEPASDSVPPPPPKKTASPPQPKRAPTPPPAEKLPPLPTMEQLQKMAASLPVSAPLVPMNLPPPVNNPERPLHQQQQQQLLDRLNVSAASLGVVPFSAGSVDAFGFPMPALEMPQRLLDQYPPTFNN